MKEYRNRGITVDALIIKSEKILLVKRKNDPFKGYWAFPGGFVDFIETAEQAAIREVKEETNMTSKKLRLLDVYSSPKRDPRQAITIAFIVTASGKEKAGDDAQEARWFSLKKLPKLAFDHAKIIRDYKKSMPK